MPPPHHSVAAIRSAAECSPQRAPAAAGDTPSGRDEASAEAGDEDGAAAAAAAPVVAVGRGFSIGRRLTETTEALVIGMQARIATRVTERQRQLRARQRRRERRQEQKAAKTLSAILLAFVVTWTPYNVFVVVTPFCQGCIGAQLFAFGRLLVGCCCCCCSSRCIVAVVLRLIDYRCLFESHQQTE